MEQSNENKLIVYPGAPDADIDQALAATGLPIIKWERRSKRVITVWIRREKPEYYSWGKPWTSLERQPERFRNAWLDERDWWYEKVKNFPAFEFYACYPAMNWVHLTVKCVTLFNNPEWDYKA